MDIVKISNELIELFFFIIGKKLIKKDVMLLVLFLVNLVIILIGVIYVDGKVVEEEKVRLKIIIYKFIFFKSYVLELIKLIIYEVFK